MPKIINREAIEFEQESVRIAPFYMPEILAATMDDYWRAKSFKSRSEFIRFAIRKILHEEGWIK